MTGKPSYLTHFECSLTGEKLPTDYPEGISPHGAPLLACYDFERLRKEWDRSSLAAAPLSMWRYLPVLPVQPENIVSLQEGWTPVLPMRRLAQKFGLNEFFGKDEGRNPTGTFKARGMAVAVSLARQRGATHLVAASLGNAAAALAAYAAAAGLPASIVVPSWAVGSAAVECGACAAQVHILEDDLAGCVRYSLELARKKNAYNVNTFHEPGRLEGKKTMGYEIAEQFGWSWPDVIVYPTGGGVGLIGIWKAAKELQQLGWVKDKLPRMVAVQPEGCQPIVKAFQEGREECEPWSQPFSLATGLKVAKPLADRLILRALRESNGTAVAVSDQEILDAGLLAAALEGIFTCPEAAACIAAIPKLQEQGFLHPGERVLVLLTGTGLKYLEAYRTRIRIWTSSEYEKLGGMILPR